MLACGGDEIRFGPVSSEGHAEVAGRPRIRHMLADPPLAENTWQQSSANAKSVVANTVDALLAEIDGGVLVAA